MANKNQKKIQNAKKSKFFVRTSLPPDFLLVKIGFLGGRGPVPARCPPGARQVPARCPPPRRSFGAFFFKIAGKTWFLKQNRQKYKEK